MERTTISLRRLAQGIALAAAIAAFAAPTGQGGVAATARFGPLDPWAYNVIHGGAASTPLVTEHSVGQNDPASNVARVARVGKYGPLDPWAQNLSRRGAAGIALITEHSAGQNGQHRVGSRAATTAERFAASNSFDWRDAGIGAASALAFVLIAAAAMLAARRRRGFAAARG